MAKTTRVVLTCDLHGDGTDAVSTLTILDGNTKYELDVCQQHLDELTSSSASGPATTQEPCVVLQAASGEEVISDSKSTPCTEGP